MPPETNDFSKYSAFDNLNGPQAEPLCLLSLLSEEKNSGNTPLASNSLDTGFAGRYGLTAFLGGLDVMNVNEAIPCLAKAAQQRRYISETVTNEDVDRWWFVGRPVADRGDRPRDENDTRSAREILQTVRRDINQHGMDPATAVVDAMRNNRVLIWGEHHASPNPNRSLGAQSMQRLRDAGATHLAIEAPTRIQPMLDEFMRTGNIDVAALPRLLRTDDYVAVLRAARAAGLRIVAVDLPVRTQDVDADRAARDPHMTAEISRILDADPNNKVVFWVGSRHGREGRDDQPGSIERASGLLRRNYSVCSVMDQMGHLGNGILCYMAGATTGGVERPVAISTRDSRAIRNLGVYNGLISNPRNPREDTSQTYGQWDIVIMYPNTPR